MYIISMKRIDLYITETQMDKLKLSSVKTGLSVAEIVRRILDAWIESQGNKLM